MTIFWPFLTRRDNVSAWRTSLVVYFIVVCTFVTLVFYAIQNAMITSQEVETAMVQHDKKREAPMVELCDYWYLPGFGSKYGEAWKSDWQVNGELLENITALHQAGRAVFHVRYRTQSIDQEGKTQKEDTLLKLGANTAGFSVSYSEYHSKYPCLHFEFTPDIQFRSSPEQFLFDKLRIYIFLQHRSELGNRPLVWRAMPPGGEYSISEKLALDKYIPGGQHRLSAKVRVRTTEYASQDMGEAFKRKMGWSVPQHQGERYEYEHFDELQLSPQWMQWYYWPLLLGTLEESSQLPPKDSYANRSLDFNKLQFVGVEFEFDTLYTERKTEKNFAFSFAMTLLGAIVAAFPIFGIMSEVWCLDVIATVKHRKGICRVPMWRRLRTFQDKEDDSDEDGSPSIMGELTHEVTRFAALRMRRAGAGTRTDRDNLLASALRPVVDDDDTREHAVRFEEDS